MNRTKIADVLHKTAVTGLMGLTLVAGGTLSYQVYQFLSMKEARKAATLKKLETKVFEKRRWKFFKKINEGIKTKDLEDAAFKCFLQRSSMENPISGPILCVKANVLAQMLSCPYFKAVLEHFKIMALVNKFTQKFQTLFRMAKCSTAPPSFSFASQPKTWKVLRANHVAVATGNLDKSVDFYSNVLGIKASEGVALPEHGVTTVFVELPNLKLELLRPLGEKSPIESFLQKNVSGGMHHICLEVDNIRNAVKDLKEKNIRMLNEEPKIGAHGKPVVFLHPKDCGGILIELEEV